MKKIKFFNLVLCFLFVPFLFANEEDLLNRSLRPSIADVEQILKPENNILSNVHSIGYEASKIARMIAELEWAYPGAIYMPLGRDVVAIGDYIDAFYRSQGQPGRVIRLNASGPSLEVEPNLIARFIQSSGVDIKNLKNGPSFVFFDVSNYTLPRASQSTKILSAVYNEYVLQGGKATDIFRKFTFFNIYRGAEGATAVDPGLHLEEFFFKLYRYLEEHPTSIPDKHLVASEMDYNTSEWHRSFGRLQERPDGSVFADPGALSVLFRREEILSQMKVMIQEVRNPLFLAAILKRAQELGYHFKFRNDMCNKALEGAHVSKN